MCPATEHRERGAAELKHCFSSDRLGAIINSSRGIIAAYKADKYKNRFNEKEFALASKLAVADMIKDISLMTEEVV